MVQIQGLVRLVNWDILVSENPRLLNILIRTYLASTHSSQFEVNILAESIPVTPSTTLKILEYKSFMDKFSKIYYFYVVFSKVQSMVKKNNNKKLPFSKAELSVLEQLSRGHSEQEIADKLHLSYHTVNNHLRNIRSRYKLQKNTEVILLYAVYLSKKKLSIDNIKKFGLSILFVAINICGISS